MKKNIGSDHKNIEHIAKEISEGVYINITRLPSHNLDFEKDLEDIFKEEKKQLHEKPLRDQNEVDGGETIGIP